MVDRRVLVVDDDTSVAETIQAILERDGYDAATAGTAEDAYKLMEAKLFNAAIIDLRLGASSGIEVLRRLRDQQPNCMAIMLTGYASLESAVEATRHGAFDYLIKPCDLDEMKLTVARAIEKGAAAVQFRERIEYLEHAHATAQARIRELEAQLRELQQGDQRPGKTSRARTRK